MVGLYIALIGSGVRGWGHNEGFGAPTTQAPMEATQAKGNESTPPHSGHLGGANPTVWSPIIFWMCLATNGHVKTTSKSASVKKKVRGRRYFRRPRTFLILTDAVFDVVIKQADQP